MPDVPSLPAEDDLKKLPLRAIVAYALRWARRVQPLLQPRRWLETRDAQLVERALDEVECFCRAEPISDVDFEAADGAARNAARTAEMSNCRSACFAARAAADAVRAAVNAQAVGDEVVGGSGSDRRVTSRDNDQPETVCADDETKDALAAVLATRAAAVPADDTPFAAVEVSRVAKLAADAAEKAASSTDSVAHTFSAADDCRRLLQLALGSFPCLGMPIDPSERGPLGKLWEGTPPTWFKRQLTLW